MRFYFLQHTNISMTHSWPANGRFLPSIDLPSPPAGGRGEHVRLQSNSLLRDRCNMTNVFTHYTPVDSSLGDASHRELGQPNTVRRKPLKPRASRWLAAGWPQAAQSYQISKFNCATTSHSGPQNGHMCLLCHSSTSVKLNSEHSANPPRGLQLRTCPAHSTNVRHLW
jgi:hypothetical protein